MCDQRELVAPRPTMQARLLLGLCQVLLLALCVAPSNDFDWTKTDRGSFYYGTFPTGTAGVVMDTQFLTTTQFAQHHV